MPDARILDVPPGSVIVLTGVDLPEDEDTGLPDNSVLSAAKKHIAEAIGHDNFAILALTEAGDVRVSSINEVLDLVAKATGQ